MTWLMMLAFACQGAWAATPIKLKVGYTNTSSFTGLFIASDQGMFSRRELDVQLLLLAVNSTMPSALLGGSIQIGGTTPPVMLQAVSGGLDIVAVAGGSVNDVRNQTGSGVVARTGVVIKTAKDFEGKRVGVPGIGAYMHVLFRRWLTEHGADDKKVKFIEVPLGQGSDILRSANVDAMLVGEPFFSRIIKSKSGYLVSPYLAQMPDGLFSIYFSASRSWAMQNPAAIKAFREALEEAKAFLARDPTKSREILAKYTKLPADVVASAVLPGLNAKIPVSDVQYWIDTLLAEGIIRSRPDAAKLVIN
jgi:NitT/TauT family transport system substrate-binding protein